MTSLLPVDQNSGSMLDPTLRWGIEAAEVAFLVQGNKLNNVGIVYTPWANLRKTQSMEAGQACRLILFAT